MKKILGLLLVLMLTLTGCSSQSSKLEEVIGKAKDDKEAFELILDYSNKNINYYKLESHIKFAEDATSYIISEIWNKDGKVYYHRKNISDTIYEETLLGSSKRSVVIAADFGDGNAQNASYKELTEKELPDTNQIFTNDYDIQEIKKEEKDDNVVFTIHSCSVFTDEETNEKLTNYYVYEYTVNSDCFITSIHTIMTDKDGHKTDFESTETYTDINQDVTFDENTIDSQMKASEGKTFKELKQ